jgi:hypothetical protein
MTATLERGASSTSTRGVAKPNFRLPVARSKKSPLMVVISALVVFASIAIFASIYAAAGHQTPVLIVTRTIEQGQPITGGDLGQASASISGGVIAIPVADAPELSGKRAAVTIPSGSLLTAGDVTGSPAIATGDAVVGLALKPGQLPSVGLTAGDRVMIIQTASPGTPLNGIADSAAGPAASTADSAADAQPSTATPSDSDGATPGVGGTTGVLVSDAAVFDVEIPPAANSSDDSILVSVEVATTLATDVSTAAAADQVSLVLLPNEPSGQAAGGTGRAGGKGAATAGGSS